MGDLEFSRVDHFSTLISNMVDINSAVEFIQ